MGSGKLSLGTPSGGWKVNPPGLNSCAFTFRILVTLADGARECVGALTCAGEDAASLWTDVGTEGAAAGARLGRAPKTKGFAKGLRSFLVDERLGIFA